MDIDALKRTVLFRRVSKETFAALKPHLTVEEASTNTPICTEGNMGDSLYYIAEGSVLLSLPLDGIERPLLVLNRGEYFGEMSMLSPGPRLVSAKSAENTILIKISNASMELLAKENPAAYGDFVAGIARLHGIKARMVSRDAAEKVTRWLGAGLIGPDKV